jgi:hypothetical protein
MGIEIEGYEYARFGELVARRQGTGAWEEATEVPEAFLEEDVIQRAMASGKVEAKRPRSNGMLMGGLAGVLVKPNPTIDATAEKLGLSAMELRAELNSHRATVTKRIPDEEFDAAMGELGLDPDEARRRFRGDFVEPPTPKPLL